MAREPIDRAFTEILAKVNSKITQIMHLAGCFLGLLIYNKMIKTVLNKELAIMRLHLACNNNSSFRIIE